MVMIVVAGIPEIQYAAIRALLKGNCPETYKEWFDFHSEKVGHLIRKKDAYQEFQIDAQEFARYCDEHL
jgi:hypothetical protein